MQEVLTQILTIVGILVILVNIVTEVVKGLINFKNAQEVNVFVTIFSEIITLASFVAYWQIKELPFTWYTVVAFVIIGVLVAFAAMFGFDKLLKYFEGIR